MNDYIWKAINNNPKLKNEMDNKFEEIFSGSMVYEILDEKGNIIHTEKVIQELNAREIIKDYQGLSR